MWSTSECVIRIPPVFAPMPRELEAERCRIVARVDHGSLGRAALGANDVAVRLNGPSTKVSTTSGMASELSLEAGAERLPVSAGQRFGLLGRDACRSAAGTSGRPSGRRQYVIGMNSTA